MKVLTIRNYLAHKAALDKQFRNWLDMGKDLFAPPGAGASPPFGAFNTLFDLFQKPATKPDKESSNK
ncbi:MAG: hypothetical protein HGA84_09530 [Syntrophobacteraceae bacterium]|nr:hypothetical protein [Syntrophobacteraceae bacterium]